MRVRNMHCRLFPALFPHVPDADAAVRAARREDVLRVGAQPPPLHVLDRRAVAAKGAVGAHAPASLHGLPQEDRPIVAARQEAASVMRAEVKGEAFLLVRLARVDWLQVRHSFLRGLVQGFPLALQVPHVHLARICPRSDDVARLRHGSNSVDASRMHRSLLLKHRLVVVVAFLIALLVVVLVVAVLPVFQRLVELGPLHHVETVVGRLPSLRASHHVGSHRIAGPLRAKVVSDNVKTQAGPLDLGSVQHVVSSRLHVQLLPLLDRVHAGAPDGLRPLPVLAVALFLLVLLVLLG
mmetsp:Transcript_47915/g.126383  ORF Transcript_47915/g.126383 Transcript_47915/m.126383 type:complete len:295 (+) Transcript_47915:427-1311(+)